jgi:hypothetical protein
MHACTLLQKPYLSNWQWVDSTESTSYIWYTGKESLFHNPKAKLILQLIHPQATDEIKERTILQYLPSSFKPIFARNELLHSEITYP